MAEIKVVLLILITDRFLKILEQWLFEFLKTLIRPRFF